MVGAIGLFEVDHSLLGRPVERQVDMRGEFQIGQFSTLGDRLDDFRREKRSGGKAFSRGALYELLSNPVYIGEIRHRKARHPGQHAPIMERELWEYDTKW